MAALSRVETSKEVVGDGGSHPTRTGTFVYVHKKVPMALNARKKCRYRLSIHQAALMFAEKQGYGSHIC